MKVAIYWYGAEGQSNYQYYTAKGDDVTIVTTAVSADYPIPDGAKAIIREDAYNHLDGFDLVVRSAGIRPDSLRTDGKIWSATNEFFANCNAPIIGVTGTKGKGTTASLIAAILKAAGKTAHLVGNIGVPPLERLAQIESDHIVVFELSSFQLWDIEYSPHIAVVLMIEPDHLNVHTDMDEYVNAKAGIARHQNSDDTIIYHPTNRYSAYIAAESDGKKMRYSIPDDGGAYVRDDAFYYGEERICSTDVMQIPGAHNIENACAAITATRAILDNSQSVEAGLRSFTGLPHRLKFVREVNGVRYYDDNYSSAPGAAIAAMRSFAQPEILIMGGYDRGLDFTELANAIIAQKNTKKIILIGETRTKIAAALDQLGTSSIYEMSDESSLEAIVLRAHELAQSGDVVIMSPGCASFDMFKNFSERGDAYIKIVEKL
jgi:UDP-N-acetylmuramoylalanine--D-glutamate ligase